MRLEWPDPTEDLSPEQERAMEESERSRSDEDIGTALTPIGVLVEAGKEAIALAQREARIKALREAWHIARNSCLIPPDGGSPTEEETAVSDRAANGIQALIDREYGKSTRL
jgi:hypothetical protein